MDKKELRDSLLDLIDGYTKDIETNLEKMAKLQTQIIGLRSINDKSMDKIRELRRKVNSLNE